MKDCEHLLKEALAASEARERELRENDARLKAMLPLFEEARDALCAITEAQRRLHGISPTLADRMDDVGIPERWRARASLPDAPAPETGETR